MCGFCKKSCHAIVQVNDEGSEPIVRFALEGNFMTDLYSFLTNEPSVYNIDATEDSGMVLIPKSASDELFRISAKYEEYIFQVTGTFIQLQKHITSIISSIVKGPGRIQAHML